MLVFLCSNSSPPEFSYLKEQPESLRIVSLHQLLQGQPGISQDSARMGSWVLFLLWAGNRRKISEVMRKKIGKRTLFLELSKTEGTRTAECRSAVPNKGRHSEEPLPGHGCASGSEGLKPEWEFGALQCHPPPARENRGSSPAVTQRIHLGWSNGSIWGWGKGETSGSAWEGWFGES